MEKRAWKIAIRRLGALVFAAAITVCVPSYGMSGGREALPGQSAAFRRPSGYMGRSREGVDFSQRPYEHFSTAVIDKAMEDFEKACKEQGQEAEVGRLYDLIISEYDKLATMAYLAQIIYDRDISDQGAAAEQAYTTDLYAEIGNKAAVCLKKGLESSYRPLLEEKIGSDNVGMIAYYEDQSQEELDRYKKEEELNREYNQMTSSDISVEVDGEEWDYERLETDKDVSTEDYRKVDEELARERNRILGGQYLELVRMRREIAVAEGYGNYVEYAHEVLYGRDYTQKDTQQLCRNVKDYIVGLYENIWDIWSRDMSNDSYESLDQLEGSSTEDILNTVGNGISQMVPELEEVFQYMRENHLYDIQGGGDGVERMDTSYTVGMPSYQDAFIFINREDTFRDYQSLIHEFGHFSSFYYDGSPELYQSFNVDVCEIQSQGLEMLSTSYARELFGDGAGAYVYEAITDMLYVTITSCMIQEFEEAVYTTPDMTLDDMNRKFKEIQDSYGVWYYRMYGDMCYDWVDIPHIFSSPMYYIGYGTSALSSLDLWVLSNDDWDESVSTYLGILNEGMDAPYKQTMAEWGMRDVFDEEDVKALAQDIERLGSMEEEEPGDSAQPEEEPAGIQDEPAEVGEGISSLFIVLMGVGTVVVLQVMILCLGLVILWVVVKRK